MSDFRVLLFAVVVPVSILCLVAPCYGDGTSGPLPSVANLSCDNVGNGVALNWTNESEYILIEILWDGLIIGTLPGDSTCFFEALPMPGPATYSVQGVSSDGCEVATAECSVVVVDARRDLVWAPPETRNGLIDDAGALMQCLGELDVFFTFSEDLPQDLSAYHRVWALLGSFPNDHVLTPVEGATLRDYCLLEQGRLYVSGSSTWGGLNPPTPLVDIDESTTPRRLQVWVARFPRFSSMASTRGWDSTSLRSQV